MKEKNKDLLKSLKPREGTIIVFGGYTLLCFYEVIYAMIFKSRVSITPFDFTVMFALSTIINLLADNKKAGLNEIQSGLKKKITTN